MTSHKMQFWGWVKKMNQHLLDRQNREKRAFLVDRFEAFITHVFPIILAFFFLCKPLSLKLLAGKQLFNLILEGTLPWSVSQESKNAEIGQNKHTRAALTDEFRRHLGNRSMCALRTSTHGRILLQTWHILLAWVPHKLVVKIALKGKATPAKLKWQLAFHF